MQADWITYKFETLSDTPWNATVLSVAFVAGNWSDLGLNADIKKLKKNSEEYFFAIKNQRDYHRFTTPETVEWWRNQPIEAQNKVLRAESKVDLSELPTAFNRFCKRFGTHDKTLVMLNGTVFHHTIMDSVYKHFGSKLPYEFWNIRDTRTILDTISNSTKLYGIDQYCKQKYGLERHFTLDECIKTMLQTSFVLMESGKALKEDYEKYGLNIFAKW